MQNVPFSKIIQQFAICYKPYHSVITNRNEHIHQYVSINFITNFDKSAETRKTINRSERDNERGDRDDKLGGEEQKLLSSQINVRNYGDSDVSKRDSSEGKLSVV